MSDKNERKLTQDLTPDQWDIKRLTLILDNLNRFFLLSPLAPPHSANTFSQILSDSNDQHHINFGHRPDPPKPPPPSREQWELHFSELVIVNLTNFFTDNPSDPPTLSFKKFSSILLDAVYSMKMNYGPRPEEKK